MKDVTQREGRPWKETEELREDTESGKVCLSDPCKVNKSLEE
jgi:hypothetical protein